MVILLATPGLPELLGATYLLAGAGVALKLNRRALGTATVVSALLCWPLYLGLLTERAAMVGPGPLGPRIRQAFDALKKADIQLSEADALRAALDAADERLAKVDRLLAEDLGYSGEVLEQLKAARAQSAEEIEAVLNAVLELRLQAGLLELAGDTAPVARRLRELRGRVEALHEIDRSLR